MSQVILDDQLAASVVLRPLQRWVTTRRLRDLRPNELIYDERVPEILSSLGQPTFVTIDHGFWNRRLRNEHYCILFFALRDDRQRLLPDLLRAVFRERAFRTRGRRMGKVARVRPTGIDFWEMNVPKLQRIRWLKPPRKG